MYEKLLDRAAELGLTVIEKYPFASERIRGLCCDDTIAISAQVDTDAERTVVLCEEIAHAMHSYGDITQDKRMEQRVRQRSFDCLIGLPGILRAFLSGCRQPWEFAEHFGVPEEFFLAAMENYKQRYGVMTKVTLDGSDYSLSFEPTLRVRRYLRRPRRKAAV